MLETIDDTFINRTHIEELVDLLVKSGKAGSFVKRRCLCWEISVDHADLDYIENSSARVFSNLLITDEIYEQKVGFRFRKLCKYLRQFSRNNKHQKQLERLSSKRFEDEDENDIEENDQKSCINRSIEDTYYGAAAKDKSLLAVKLKENSKHYWRYFQVTSEQLDIIEEEPRKSYFIKLIEVVDSTRNTVESLHLAETDQLQRSLIPLAKKINVVISTCEDVSDLLDVNSGSEQNQSSIKRIENLTNQSKTLLRHIITARKEIVERSTVSVAIQRQLKYALKAIIPYFDYTLAIYEEFGGILATNEDF